MELTFLTIHVHLLGRSSLEKMVAPLQQLEDGRDECKWVSALDCDVAETPVGNALLQ